MISSPVATSIVPLPHTEIVLTHANAGDAVCSSTFWRSSRSPVVFLGSVVPVALSAIRAPVRLLYRTVDVQLHAAVGAHQEVVVGW